MNQQYVNDDSIDIGLMKAKLLNEKAFLAKKISRQEQKLKPVLGDNPDRSDLAQAYMNQERKKSLLIRAKEDLALIEMALKKIQTGVYGQCASCQGPISKERLGALPYAMLCIDCKTKKERK